MRIGTESKLIFLVTSVSLMQFYATNRVLGEYVTRVYKIQQDAKDVREEDTFLEIETTSLMGSNKSRAAFLRDLYGLSPGLVKLKTSGESFYFCPHILSQSASISHLAMAEK